MKTVTTEALTELYTDLLTPRVAVYRALGEDTYILAVRWYGLYMQKDISPTVNRLLENGERLNRDVFVDDVKEIITALAAEVVAHPETL